MPKKAYIASHLTVGVLKEKYQNAQDPVESRRWHLLWKIANGWTIKNSAIAIGINYEYAQKILQKYNKDGEEGVKNKRKDNSRKTKGRQPLLNETQMTKLAEALKNRPSDGGIWTGPKVARWIELETGRTKVAKQRGWDYLKKQNYSCQSPRPKHKKGNPMEQEKFKADFPEKVKKVRESYPDAQVEVWFFDEHRVGLKPIIRKIWAPKGERPIAIVEHKYEWLYVYGFVEPKTGRTYFYLIPRVNTEWLNLVYEAFAKDVGVSEQKKVLLLEDNAGWHRSKKAQALVGIIRDNLPPYSPELQPAERLWKLLDEPLVNECFQTLVEIEEKLLSRCLVLNELAENIKDLTNYHWLNYT
jgi:transposase